MENATVVLKYLSKDKTSPLYTPVGLAAGCDADSFVPRLPPLRYNASVDIEWRVQEGDVQ